MNPGDLVQLFLYSPHSSKGGLLATTPQHLGIFIEEMNTIDAGWKVLVNDEIKLFTKMYWRCEKVIDELSEEQLETVCGGMDSAAFEIWRCELINEDR